jgi:hypothetical protein
MAMREYTVDVRGNLANPAFMPHHRHAAVMFNPH